MPPSKQSDNTCLRAGSKDRMGRWVSAGGRSLTRSMGMTVLSCLQGTCGRKARHLSLLEGDLHQEASLPSATDRWKPLSHHSLSTEEVPGKYVWLPDLGSPGGRGKEGGFSPIEVSPAHQQGGGARAGGRQSTHCASRPPAPEGARGLLSAFPPRREPSGPGDGLGGVGAAARMWPFLPSPGGVCRPAGELRAGP